MSWVLILYIYAGALSKGDHVALTTISGFTTLQACEQAGQKTKEFTNGMTLKDSKYVCVQTG